MQIPKLILKGIVTTLSVQNMGKYVDTDWKDINHSVLQPLLTYAFSKSVYGMGVDQIQTMVFENSAEFNAFLNALHEFFM